MMIRSLALLLALAAGLPVQAQDTVPVQPLERRAPESPSNFFVGLGAGGYVGEEYEKPSGCCFDPEAYEVGGYALHASFNVAMAGTLVRFRHSLLTAFTSNVADETALAFGLALTPERNVWATVGVSRLTDVSNQKKSPTVGVPIELIAYPVRGLELMLHGNVNGDSNFIGVAIAGAIGRQRR